MASDYYSDPNDVMKEASVSPEDLDETTDQALYNRVERYLIGVKGLMDEYTGRNFHEEYATVLPSGVTDYSKIPQVIHLIALRAGANAVQSSVDRGGPMARGEDEYKTFMFRDEILSPSIRRELDLFKKAKQQPTNTRSQLGFGMIRVRNPREISEDKAAGRFR